MLPGMQRTPTLWVQMCPGVQSAEGCSGGACKRMVNRSGHNEPLPPWTTRPVSTLLPTLASSHILGPAQGCVAVAPFTRPRPPPLWSRLTGRFRGFQGSRSQQSSCSPPSAQPVGPLPALSPPTHTLRLLNVHLPPGGRFREAGTGSSTPEGAQRVLHERLFAQESAPQKFVQPLTTHALPRGY